MLLKKQSGTAAWHMRCNLTPPEIRSRRGDDPLLLDQGITIYSRSVPTYDKILWSDFSRKELILICAGQTIFGYECEEGHDGTV